MRRIKDLYLSLLAEGNENFFYVDDKTIGKIEDVHYNVSDDYLKVDFNTTYNKPASLVTKYKAFQDWFNSNGSNYPPQSGQLYKEYLKYFIQHSKETGQGQNTVKEIIDQDGNIMPSTDTPSNSTNSMIGANLTWDLEKVYKSAIPKSIRFYSGDLGIGIISW